MSTGCLRSRRMCSPSKPSSSHLVLIPSYNTGRRLLETVNAACQFWQPVWVIVDGSTDGGLEKMLALQADSPGLRVISRPTNGGKGTAVRTGMVAAKEAGFRYALVMDADGQHPADRIPEFMRLSAANPSAMILGEPEFAADAPFSRRYGRRVGNWWAQLETAWGGVHDSLFGFRVYPISESLEILEKISGGRRYDFDTELAVRLYWRGVRPANVKVPVTYISRREGGVSHFHYARDNLMLIKAHIGLLALLLTRLPHILRLRGRS